MFSLVLYLFAYRVVSSCIFPLPFSGASSVRIVKTSPVKMVGHVLTAWMVPSVSVIRVLGEKGKWLLPKSVSARLPRVTPNSRYNGSLVIWSPLLQIFLILP